MAPKARIDILLAGERQHGQTHVIHLGPLAEGLQRLKMHLTQDVPIASWGCGLGMCGPRHGWWTSGQWSCEISAAAPGKAIDNQEHRPIAGQTRSNATRTQLHVGLPPASPPCERQAALQHKAHINEAPIGVVLDELSPRRTPDELDAIVARTAEDALEFLDDLERTVGPWPELDKPHVQLAPAMPRATRQGRTTHEQLEGHRVLTRAVPPAKFHVNVGLHPLLKVVSTKEPSPCAQPEAERYTTSFGN